ncbi:MAG: hypothetical protein IJ317_03990 [Clostridia bacterium]|nr:hypothetical protein [Clostridia bacterium]
MKDRKNILKTVGVILLIVGLALTAFGVYDYITALVDKIAPKYFWCAGLGLPVLGLGLGFAFFAGKTQPPKEQNDENKENTAD